MKKLKLNAYLLVGFLLIVFGCKDVGQNSMTPEIATYQNERAATRTSAVLTLEQKEKLETFASKLPKNILTQLRIKESIANKIDPYYSNMVKSLSKAVEPTPCDDNTPIIQWLRGELIGWSEVVNDGGSSAFDYADDLALLDLPTVDALLFENSSDNQYFGIHGEYTQQSTKTFKDLKRFWNINSSGMVLGGMHGSMLLDRNKIIRAYLNGFEGINQQVAEDLADYVLYLMEIIPQYRNGDHPIFTFNAFALNGFESGSIGIIPSKIIMGDGIVLGYATLGYLDVATESIMSHEYGHQIQFQLSLFEEHKSPEATRRTELMADAYSAYYLTHARGATMQWKRVQLFLKVFSNIGDCSFTSNSHHGTPAQRVAAATWGNKLAENTKQQGSILSTQEFTALFEAELPHLIMF